MGTVHVTQQGQAMTVSLLDITDIHASPGVYGMVAVYARFLQKLFFYSHHIAVGVLDVDQPMLVAFGGNLFQAR